MPTPPTDPPVFVVRGEDVGRLDRFLVRRLPGLSRRRTRAIIASGAVRVNGRPARKGAILRSDDVVQLAAGALVDGDLLPQPALPARVLFADAAVVAVDKPAGMPAVALRTADRDTLANFLLAHFPELAGAGRTPLDAGLVHRLDVGTSGIMVAGRTREAYRRLREQFEHRAVRKLYVAAVRGVVAQGGIVRTPIAHRPRRPRAMCACQTPERAHALGARPAMTVYRPLARAAGATLVAVRISTGVRHQIRVHLAALGHPVLGDALYGGAGAARAAPRLMLHAARLALRHPVTGARLVLRSALPGDFLAAWRRQLGNAPLPARA